MCNTLCVRIEWPNILRNTIAYYRMNVWLMRSIAHWVNVYESKDHISPKYTKTSKSTIQKKASCRWRYALQVRWYVLFCCMPRVAVQCNSMQCSATSSFVGAWKPVYICKRHTSLPYIICKIFLQLQLHLFVYMLHLFAWCVSYVHCVSCS